MGEEWLMERDQVENLVHACVLFYKGQEELKNRNSIECIEVG